MKIIGLRIEKYIDKGISGHNCDFEYADEEFEKHILCAVLSNDKKVEITLSRSEGECMSGWTSASWGDIEIKEVQKFNGYNYLPKKTIEIDDISPEWSGDELSNELFSFSQDGGCNYYPSGDYNVNMELFEETVRTKKKRPVWLFKGKSNSGKSFLSSKLQEMEVYETDSNEELPKVITASIIVLGNKFNFKIEDIEKVIFGEYEIQIVDFL